MSWLDLLPAVAIIIVWFWVGYWLLPWLIFGASPRYTWEHHGWSDFLAPSSGLVPMRLPPWLCRLLGGHRWPRDWRLEPALITVPVGQLYWLRRCNRCRKPDRRWFAVNRWQPPRSGVSVQEYLRRGASRAPDPETLLP